MEEWINNTIESLNSTEEHLRTIVFYGMLIAVENVGITQFFKNFRSSKNTKIGNKPYFKYAMFSFIFCLLSTWINMYFNGKVFQFFFNLFIVSLSISQIGYEIILQSFPRFVQFIVDKMLGKAIENKTKTEG